jgi:prevent-host-death family protein
VSTITINAKQLRASLPKLVERVRKGARFVVIYRSRPAFQIVPVDDTAAPHAPLEADTLYRATPVGRSADGRTATEHDAVLYGR